MPALSDTEVICVVFSFWLEVKESNSTAVVDSSAISYSYLTFHVRWLARDACTPVVQELWSIECVSKEFPTERMAV